MKNLICDSFLFLVKSQHFHSTDFSRLKKGVSGYSGRRRFKNTHFSVKRYIHLPCNWDFIVNDHLLHSRKESKVVEYYRLQLNCSAVCKHAAFIVINFKLLKHQS